MINYSSIIIRLTVKKEYEANSCNQTHEKQSMLAEATLTQLIQDYDFIVYSTENIDSIDIKKSYAYLERNIFKKFIF